MQPPQPPLNPYQAPNPAAVPPPLSTEANATGAIYMEGVVEWEDYSLALRLHSRAAGRVTRGLRSVSTLLLVCFCMWLVSSNRGFDRFSLILPGFMLVVMLVLYGWASRRTLRNSWNQSIKIREPFTRVITEESIHATTPSTTATSRWTAFVKAKRSPEIILLYSDTLGPLHIFPRRLFRSEHDWNRFVALVSQKFPE